MPDNVHLEMNEHTFNMLYKDINGLIGLVTQHYKFLIEILE